jgi:hypothetical protein
MMSSSLAAAARRSWLAVIQAWSAKARVAIQAAGLEKA